MKTIVEIEWDEPSGVEYQAWLCADNISIALHSYCSNTKFKVRKVVPIDWKKVWDEISKLQIGTNLYECIQELVEKQLRGEE